MARKSTSNTVESTPDLQELLTLLVGGMQSINARLDLLESGTVETPITNKPVTRKAYKSKYDMVEIFSGVIPERYNESDNTQPIEFTVYHAGAWTWLYTTAKPVGEIREVLKNNGLKFSGRRYKATGIGAYCNKAELLSNKSAVFGKFARYITVNK